MVTSNRSRGRRRSGGSGTAGSRMQKAWYNQHVPPTLVAPGLNSLGSLLVPGTMPNGFQVCTILRFIGRLRVYNITSGQENIGAFGCTVMRRDDLVAADPSSLADLLDWYYLTRWSSWQLTTQGSGFLVEFDIRSMRKIRGEDRSLIFSFENETSSAGTVEYAFETRLLLGR